MIEPSRPLQRPRRIFSGEDSKVNWQAIMKAKVGSTEMAGFAFGLLAQCCQELELLVCDLEDRIAKLEDR